jgi:predicted enzyme related to lactoylglutathione lyase
MAKRLASILAIATGVAALAALAAPPPVTIPLNPVEPRIAELKVYVTDLDRSAAFYKSVFQMQEIERVHGQTVQESVLKFGATLETAKADIHTGIVLVSGPGTAGPAKGTNETPLAVLTVPDVAATMKRAADAGVPQTGRLRQDEGGRLSAGTVNDPNGNVIELIHMN